MEAWLPATEAVLTASASSNKKTRRKRLSTSASAGSGSFHSFSKDDSDFEGEATIGEDLVADNEGFYLASRNGFSRSLSRCRSYSGPGRPPHLRSSLSTSDSAINLKLKATKPIMVLVFLSGVALATIVLFMSEFVKVGNGFEPPERSRWAKGIGEGSGFSLLPDASQLVLADENFPLEHDPLQRKPEAAWMSLGGEDPRRRLSVNANHAEAVGCIKAAIILKEKGQVDKARKLFLHAMALSSKNPAVLNAYGEFLEEVDEDLVEADHMFAKAFLFSSSGIRGLSDPEQRDRALMNRRRTAVLVEEIDTRWLHSIDAKKKLLHRLDNSGPGSGSSAAFRRAKKEAYFQHVHHTVAIEGNTMSLVQTRSILETKMAVGGKSVMEHNEILGLDAALKYINQTLVDRSIGDVRLQDLLEIHKRVVGFADPVEAGLFRRNQVFVGDHIPPKADLVDSLIQRFLLWLNSAEALTMHPVRLAALAHYKLVYIHPFVDGNGRTSRLLMNLILMQHGFPPVIVRKQDRLAYYQHIVTANYGDIRPFIRFIAKCTERTLDAYLAATKDHSLVPFSTDEAETIHASSRHDNPEDDFRSSLEHYDKVIMGGIVDDIVTDP